MLSTNYLFHVNVKNISTKIQVFFKKIKAKFEAFGGVGGRKDLRIEGKDFLASVFKLNGEILNLAVFPE